MSAGPDGVPDLGDVAGHWIEAGELAHLPSLRNQRGQAHVNADLGSLSWIAAPPYAFGYHTGVLSLDGAVPDTQRYLWKPWGVQREHRGDGFRLLTDTRMALGQDQLLWRISLTNTSTRRRTFALRQDLYAMVSRSETGWGWLYDVPWTDGNYHDFFALERIRATTTRPDAGSVLPAGDRRLRLGRPRTPGIQRDEDASPMLLEYELPAHVSADKVSPDRPGAHGAVRGIVVHSPERRYDFDGEFELDPDTEQALDAFPLTAGGRIAFDFRTSKPGHDGVILTHGNHPDSLQVGLEHGRLWVAVSGEREHAGAPLAAESWHAITVAVDERGVALSLDGIVVAATKSWTVSRRWSTVAETGMVNSVDLRSHAAACFAFAVEPTQLNPAGSGAHAEWCVDLSPGQTRTVGIVCAYGDDREAAARTARRVADRFDATMDTTEHGWRALWSAMFTPGNNAFSGHLPTLRTTDRQLATAYYMGALTALYLRNPSVSATGPVFLTGGPRLGPTTTFYWDHAEWSRLYAMLEPAGLRAWLLRVLAGPYRDSFGIDTRGGGPLGNEYAANDYSLFRLTEHYTAVTGDLGFLDEVAGDRTVAQHLEALAYGWTDRQNPATGGLLADFGDDPWRLLECVPSYVNVVASFNAAYVAMTRSLASLLRYLGRTEDADRAAADADLLARAVLDLYAGSGRWSIRHGEHTETIGHCLDFGLVAASLPADLSLRQSTEMVDFVTGYLLDGGWMRALSPDTPIAAASDRPDHGAGGAFCAWPGVTAQGLAALGRPDLALDLLRRTPAAASGALWGQAMEIIDGRARVAERGVSNRDSIGAVATAEAVVSGLFGVDPSFADLGTEDTPPDSVKRDGLGSLHNLNLCPLIEMVDQAAPDRPPCSHCE